MEKFIKQTEKISELFHDQDKAKTILMKILLRLNELNASIIQTMRKGMISFPKTWSKEDYQKELYLYKNDKRVLREINTRLRRHLENNVSKIDSEYQLVALEYIEAIMPEPNFFLEDNIKSNIYGVNVFPRRFFKELEEFFDNEINSEIKKITIQEYEYQLNRFIRKATIGFDSLNEFIVRKKTYDGNFDNKN